MMWRLSPHEPLRRLRDGRLNGHLGSVQRIVGGAVDYPVDSFETQNDYVMGFPYALVLDPPWWCVEEECSQDRFDQDKGVHD